MPVERRIQSAPIDQAGERVGAALPRQLQVLLLQFLLILLELQLVPVAFAHVMAQLVVGAPQLHQRDDLARQAAHRIDLKGFERARLLVDHAQGAYRVAGRRHQRRAGVEAHVGVAGHHRVVEEALVGERVVHDEQVVRVMDRMRTERHVARGLLRVHAVARLEPLALAIDQADRAHRRAADRRGDFDEVVVGLLRHGVEDAIAVEFTLSLGFAGRNVRGRHGAFSSSSGRFRRGWPANHPRADRCCS
jgi:hypothetical protein